MRKTTCSRSGFDDAVLREHLFDEALVPRVGELVVAAHRVGLAQPLRAVGVVAVGGAGRRHDDAPHAGGDAGLEHVARAVDIDAVLEVMVASGVDDRGEVHDDVDPVPLEQRHEAG